MSSTRSLLTILGLGLGLALAAGGCAFEAPSFDGTSYRCAPPDDGCPPGFACAAGVCVAGEVDAGPDEDDAGGGDAGPDGGGGGATRYAFGERPDADHTGVTTDTTLDSDAPTPPRGANDFVAIDAGPERVALMRFDTSAIPTTAVVTAAQLEVTIYDPLESGTFQLYRVAEAWQEASATWDERVGGVPWLGPGASGASRLPMLVGESAPRAPATFTVTLAPAAVQAWVSSPDSNFGLVWISTSPDGRGGELRSSEAAVALERPLLRVNVAP